MLTVFKTTEFCVKTCEWWIYTTACNQHLHMKRKWRIYTLAYNQHLNYEKIFLGGESD